MSTALTTLVMENFPLFSPRTLESPCTGTKRSPDDPLVVVVVVGVLQAASGEAALEGRCSQPWGCASSHLLQLPKAFLDLCRENGSMIRRGVWD